MVYTPFKALLVLRGPRLRAQTDHADPNLHQLYHPPALGYVTMRTSIGANALLNLALCPGYDLPLLGFGVYLNNDPKPAVLAALNAGYRYVSDRLLLKRSSSILARTQTHRYCAYVRK